MPDEKNINLITTLEDYLRQTRKAQQQLIKEREELRADALEVERISYEIDTLENAAKQTESAIYSLLATMRRNQS